MGARCLRDGARAWAKLVVGANEMKIEIRIEEKEKGKSRSKSTSVSAVVLAAFAFAIFIVAPAIAGTVTYDYDDAGRLVKGDYGDGTAIEYEYDDAGNLLEREIIGERPVFFDTGPGTYPSISGTHEGTIKPNQTITVSKLYTYPCSGTGGHSEHVRIWNDTWAGMEASWTGYLGDWHNVTFPESFTLVANEIYNYTIRTGSYPQIHHTPALQTLQVAG